MSDKSLVLPLPMGDEALANVSFDRVAEGFDDVARHLDIPPEKLIGMNSLVPDLNDPDDRKVAATDDLDVRATQYPLLLAGKEAAVAHFNLTAGHADYMRAQFSDRRFLPIEPTGPGRLAPDGSLIAGIKAAFRREARMICASGQSLKDQFAGKILANSYCLNDLQDLALMVGGSTLNETDAYLRFLCKSFVRDQAEAYGIPVAPGLVIRSPEDIVSGFAAMEKKIRDLGLRPDQTKCWIKAGALSGGQGIVSISGLTETAWQSAFTRIARAYHDSGFFQKDVAPPQGDDFKGVDYFMPIIVDVDVGCLPQVQGVDMNACVQAVVGRRGVVFIGTTLQQTKDGEYYASVMPRESQRPQIEVAQKGAQSLLHALWCAGYQGIAGVDVLVLRTKEGLKPNVLEVNPRINSSTPLLSFNQRVIAMAEAPRTGNSANYLLPAGGDPMDLLIGAIGESGLYRGERSGHMGLVPAMIDQPPGRPTLVKGVVIGKDPEDASRRQEEIYKKIQQTYKDPQPS